MDALVTADAVVINEFVVRPRPGDREFVELMNRSPHTVSLGGWSLEVQNADSTIGRITFSAADSLAPGAYTARWDTSMVKLCLLCAPGMLPDPGGVILLKDAALSVIDSVGYGNLGGAPISCPLVVPAGVAPPPGFSVASGGPNPQSLPGLIPAAVAADAETLTTSTVRLPDGTDSGNDAQDFNVAPPTAEAMNTGAAADLGSSVRINAANVYPRNDDLSPVNEAVQLYNPTLETRDIRIAWVSDGYLIQQLLPSGAAAPLEAGRMYTVIAGLNGTGGFEFDEDDRMDLYEERPAGLVRVDQLGWSQVPTYFPDLCLERVPDGAGPSDGWDWNTSGGNQWLYYLTCDLSTANTGTPQEAGRRSALSAARPNPARGTTAFELTVGEGGPARVAASVTLHDVAGRLVRRLGEADYSPGRYSLVWYGRSEDGRSVPSGIYFARLAIAGRPIGEVRTTIWLGP